MTAQQVAHTIAEALYECDFNEWDISHQLSQLCEDKEDGTLDDESVADEVESCIDNAKVGEELAKIVKEALVAAIQAEA